MKNSLFFLLTALLVLGTVAMIVHFGTKDSQVDRQAPKDPLGPQQKSEYVKIRVDAPSLAEVHIFYDSGHSSFGRTPFEVVLPRSQVCAWGMDIAARTPVGAYSWWGCNVGTPSKASLVVEIDGVLTQGTLTPRVSACNAMGEGNLAFDLKQFGCL